jgi:hypothetical protein
MRNSKVKQTGSRLLLITLLLTLAAGQAYAQQTARDVYLQGRENLIEERFERALRNFRSVVADFPESEEADDAQFYIGYTLERMGRTREALEAFETLLTRWPDSVRAENARTHQVELMGLTEQTSDPASLERLLTGNVAWSTKRETAYALARSGNFSGATILEEAMSREGSSRKIELIKILERHTSDPVARRILVLGLEPSNSSSVQLQTLSALQSLVVRTEINLNLARVLEGSASSSVKQKTIQILRPHIELPGIRSALVLGLQSRNSSSVQLLAAAALRGHMTDPEVMPATIQFFQQPTSSSVGLEILKSLEADRENPEIVEILRSAVNPRNASSVQLKAMSIARSSRNPQVRAAARAGLAPGASSSVQLEALKALGVGRNEAAASEALEEMFRQRGMSSSVQLQGLEALGNHLETPVGPRALAAALNPSHSSSVLMRAMDLAGRSIQQEVVRTAVLRLLQEGGTSTSVQLEAIKVLSRQVSNAEVRQIIGASLHPSNSTSVQLKAIDALDPQVSQADVRQAFIGTLERRYSTSVILSAMESLEDYVQRDERVERAYVQLMENERVSSTARIRAGESLLPGANARRREQIADAMEDVIIRLARARIRPYPTDRIDDALDVIGKIDPERARALAERYRRPRSILRRLINP